MIGTASLMTMRATLERNTSTADAYGAKASPSQWSVTGDEIPCFVWVTSERDIFDDRKDLAVESIKAIFRFDFDLRRGDRIIALLDRRGRDIMEGFFHMDEITEIGAEDSVSGRLEVETVAERHAGIAQGHKEATLKRQKA